MTENFRLARPFLILVIIFAAGRWAMGVQGVPYEKGHHIFSLVILTWTAAAFYGMFTRRWRGVSVGRAAALGATLGLIAQVAVFLATTLSYVAGLDTYFNHPMALVRGTEPVPFGQALGSRAGGLVVNVLISAIVGVLGWFLGGTLPDAGGSRTKT